MKAAALLMFTIFAAASVARADFSYTTTRKTTGGAMAAMAGNNNQTSKQYYKGQKMKVENGDTAIIVDFDAQTITTVNNKSKTVSVKSLSDLSPAGQSDLNAKVESRETGQKKTVNGYDATELIVTMDIDSPEARQLGKMQMEMDLWLSPDVPGASEMRAFYEKNASHFPWGAMSGNGNQALQSGIADLQRKIASMRGVPVLQVVKVKSAGGAAAPVMPQMTPEQSAKMQAAMAQMAAMQKQGGPAAAAAAQAMARLGAVNGSSAGASPSSALIEMTMESSDFSTSSIPDSVFAIPADYRK